MADELERSDSEDESDFVDADENLPPLGKDFAATIEDARLAVHYFFNNDFLQARKILEPHSKTSMYHALGVSVFEFLEAFLTFEPQQIEKASLALRQTRDVCNKYRHKNSITRTLGKMVGTRTNYDSFTEEQVHAELCFAEGLLLKAMLSFVEDETLVSFIKASLKIRSCFAMYKVCNEILKTRKWTDEKLKVHFESGVRMGIGAFNLMISLLPSRAIKLLEFIGFSGNKQLGLKELEKGYELKNSIRQVLSVMTLLGYHLIVTYVITNRDGDLGLCEQILKEQLMLYPKGVWFLFFKGRLELMRGNLEEAQIWYKKSWRSQDLWPQFHHLCFWELMWTSAIQMDWTTASEYAGRLLKESKWSRTIYSYQRASLLLMHDELSDDQRVEVEELLRNAPRFVQRIAGKSLPMEKFVVRRSNRFYSQKKWLCLPAIELLYLWNLFKPLSKNKYLLMNMLRVVEKAMDTVPANEYQQDNQSLLHLLKGVALRFLSMFVQAEDCFCYVLDNAKKLKEDTFLVPFATFELALVEIEQKHYAKAAGYLEDAKKNFTGYSMESRLHFKIHSAFILLDEVAAS